MRTALKTYLKKPQTTVAIVVALMAQIIFCVVWMTAYDGVMDRTDRLKIAFVNEDGEFGQSVERQLRDELPFPIVSAARAEAMDDLTDRSVQLAVIVPNGFGESLTAPGKQATLSYVMNDANPQLAKSVMQTVAANLTAGLNKQAALQGTTVALRQSNLPEEEAGRTAQGLLDQVGSDMAILNPVKGMHNQMVPMMLILASYVGAMLMAMNVHQASEAIGARLTVRRHIAVRSLLIVLAALVISLVGSSLIAALGGQMYAGFASFWLFHFLTMLAFMFFAQLFLISLGMAGMFVNMAVLSLQLVTSGTIVPRPMLSGFYQALGHYLPATYAVEGIMNLQFGGAGSGKDALLLAATIAASLAVSWAVAGLRGRRGAGASARTEADALPAN